MSFTYSSSFDHVLDELRRIDMVLQMQLGQMRQRAHQDDDFYGLYLSEHDLDALNERPFEGPTTQKSMSASSPTRNAIEELEREISRRRTVAVECGLRLRLDGLSQVFDLTPFDTDALLLCLAPSFDLRYERFYAYLQDDVTKKRPTVDLILSLFCSSLQERIGGRQRFAQTSPLVRHELIALAGDLTQPSASLLGQHIKIDERIVGYLFDSDALDAGIVPFCRMVDPGSHPDGVGFSEGDQQRLMRIVSPTQAGNRGIIVALKGDLGVGRRAAAEAACMNCGMNLLTVNGQRLHDLEKAEFERVTRRLLREALLQDAAILFTDFEGFFADSRAPQLGALSELLEDRKGLTFIATSTHAQLAGKLGPNRFIEVELPPPVYHERAALWTHAVAGMPGGNDIDVTALAGQFRLTRGQIRDAAAAARTAAIWRDSEHPQVTTSDLQAACRARSNQNLASLAKKIAPGSGWDDIVLPPARVQQLREVFDAARQRSRVYDDWGFGAKLSLGKGLSVLFSGPSGTGKTMAAEILAGALGLDLYKIDLSAVVSKYIGETEKNLARIFQEAETANAILLFDEADALFGKRSEVRDAHDRYANIETGYLLQRMEAYEGLVILTTNLAKNLDEAFVRRLHFMLDFPFPSAEERRRIWAGVWPQATPLEPDLDLDLIAERFEVAGGNIKNIALASAFMAAADGGAVTLDHILRATQREYQKMGKVIVGSEFVRPVAGASRTGPGDR